MNSLCHCLKTLQEFAPAEKFPELQQGQLLELVERWLRAEKAERKARKAAAPKAGKEAPASAVWNNGWAPGRLTSSIRQADGTDQMISGTMAHSSNTVMRM